MVWLHVISIINCYSFNANNSTKNVLEDLNKDLLTLVEDDEIFGNVAPVLFREAFEKTMKKKHDCQSMFVKASLNSAVKFSVSLYTSFFQSCISGLVHSVYYFCMCSQTTFNDYSKIMHSSRFGHQLITHSQHQLHLQKYTSGQNTQKSLLSLKC